MKRTTLAVTLALTLAACSAPTAPKPVYVCNSVTKDASGLLFINCIKVKP